MENFLDKLYSNPYFFPVLCVIIGCLFIAFIIVLSMAIKDARRNKRNNNVNSNNNAEAQNAFQQVQTPAVDVSVQPNIDNQNLEINQQPVMPVVSNDINFNNNVNNDFNNNNVFMPNNNFDITIDNPVEESSKEVVLSSDNNNTADAPIEIEPNIQQYTNIFPQVSDSSEIEITNETNEVPTPSIKVPSSDEPTNYNINNFSIGNSVTTEDDINKAESDLDEIAATLLAEYKKENLSAPEVASSNVVENKEIKKDPFSSIYVTPEVNQPSASVSSIPSFADIPTPQPVRVVNSSAVIDSSKQNNGFDFNSIATEEYNLKK